MTPDPESQALLVCTLQQYFDALHYCDMDLLERVFHPLAIYACPTGGVLSYLTMEEYFPIVAARTPPASKGEKRLDAIEMLSFAGPETAFARVRCAIGPKYFTDFLTLIFQQDRWQIISKVFHYDLLGEEET